LSEVHKLWVLESSGQPNFVHWQLTFVVPEYGTFLLSPFLTPIILRLLLDFVKLCGPVICVMNYIACSAWLFWHLCLVLLWPLIIMIRIVREVGWKQCKEGQGLWLHLNFHL